MIATTVMIVMIVIDDRLVPTAKNEEAQQQGSLVDVGILFLAAEGLVHRASPELQTAPRYR